MTATAFLAQTTQLPAYPPHPIRHFFRGRVLAAFIALNSFPDWNLRFRKYTTFGERMKSTLPLPKELESLIAEGLWPTCENAQRQNLSPILEEVVVDTFAPDEDGFFLYPFPFRTVAEDRKHNRYWDEPANALHEIDPHLAPLLGDFGLGSDTAIILDYRKDPPELLRLKWGEENHWIPLGLSMAEFANHIRKAKSKQE